MTVVPGKSCFTQLLHDRIGLGQGNGIGHFIMREMCFFLISNNGHDTDV